MRWAGVPGADTFASLPVVAEHVAVRTGAESRAQRVETGVRAAEIVAGLDALVQVFAGNAVGRQLSSGPLVAAALVRAVRVAASALARAVTVSQQTFVVI